MTHSRRQQRPAYWTTAKRLLGRRDPVLAGLFERFPGESLSSRGEPFATLCQSIVGQQISSRAAEAIWSRLEARLGGRVTPTRLLQAADFDGVGLSRRKEVYLVSLAEFVRSRRPGHLTRTAPDQLERELLGLPGVGPWTWHMFAIFSRMDPDIFPDGDLGVIRSTQTLYPAVTDKRGIMALAERWRPYRTVASWYLWRHRDGGPVSY